MNRKETKLLQRMIDERVKKLNGGGLRTTDHFATTSQVAALKEYQESVTLSKEEDGDQELEDLAERIKRAGPGPSGDPE